MQSRNNRLENIDPDYNFFDESSLNSCSYFTTDNLTSNIHLDSKFSLLSYNIRSFAANNTLFEPLLGSLNLKFDCIILTETYNSPNNVDFCNLGNYNAVHTFRFDCRGGGVSVFCK